MRHLTFPQLKWHATTQNSTAYCSSIPSKPELPAADQQHSRDVGHYLNDRPVSFWAQCGSRSHVPFHEPKPARLEGRGKQLILSHRCLGYPPYPSVDVHLARWVYTKHSRAMRWNSRSWMIYPYAMHIVFMYYTYIYIYLCVCARTLYTNTCVLCTIYVIHTHMCTHNIYICVCVCARTIHICICTWTYHYI